MAKKGSLSSKRASQTREKNIVVEKGKPYSTVKKPVGEGKAEAPKTFGFEIDEIFSSKKKPVGEGKAEAPKTFGFEIDEIFSSKKRKKPDTEEKLADNKAAISNTKQKRKSHAKIKPTKDIKGPLDTPSGPRKRTKDGLVVYTEEELGFGKSDAGGTRLCPFDCDCCF